RRLSRIAQRRLVRLDSLVQRRVGGECEIELHDMLEGAAQCTACPFNPGNDDDQGDNDHGGGD
ncbi:MAG TPA: hypothetical protein VKH82_09860, partial [Candidatus Binatia bacterium]|nr:hypothetical protein [Candidatus Binatia bacterium]